MKNFKAVLFDLDGTLVRTMEAHFEAWQKACRDFDFEITGDDFFPLEGINLEEEARIFCRKYKTSESHVNSLVERKKNYFLEKFFGGYPDFYPGAEKLLFGLRERGMPLALVTASLKEQVKVSLPRKVFECFDVIVSGGETERGKPFPDPYLKGAELLKIEPKYCIAVENAPLGVKSAKSAGIYCIAVAHTVPKEQLQEADEVIDSISYLLNDFKKPR